VLAIYASGERGVSKTACKEMAVIVVDAFRASTTIAVLVRKGAQVMPVASIDEAAAYAGADYRVGERGGAKVQGFDFGNPPTEVEASELEPDATVVLSTTNGTHVIEAASGAPATFTDAFVNADAVAEALASGAYRTGVAVIGCGWEGHRASEDESAAERSFSVSARGELG
jgi:2-phosphosulfolactate phosphatase